MMGRVLFIIILIIKKEKRRSEILQLHKPPIRACKVPTVWSHDEITNVLLPCRRTPDITNSSSTSYRVWWWWWWCVTFGQVPTV
jgi:hypothetical protein